MRRRRRYRHGRRSRMAGVLMATLRLVMVATAWHWVAWCTDYLVTHILPLEWWMVHFHALSSFGVYGSRLETGQRVTRQLGREDLGKPS